jgi:hypothetical protein
MFMNLIENDFIGRQITFIGNPSHDSFIGKIIVIIRVVANVKEAVFPVAERLMNLKVETN